MRRILSRDLARTLPGLIRSPQPARDADFPHKKILWAYNPGHSSRQAGLATHIVLKAYRDYFFRRLVWLATHCHLPPSMTQVSVKRPTWSYGFPGRYPACDRRR